MISKELKLSFHEGFYSMIFRLLVLTQIMLSSIDYDERK